ncbi:rRNA-processing UTP23 [Fusarium heterosporum]|uniref:U three protein 23 n=1 Tax=Fusarium heterosporum TaxID=42747 RepID=A0A8H5TBM9_FUSHE|nr:rRNA-processing UTP23 [Fusarium heterosporum]
MRGKRSKQYRKLMEQFSQTFGFREPYQVLVDAEMVRDSSRCKMDLEPALTRTVHGKVKPMITQCEIRKLYAQKEPGTHEAIELAKTLERRRCGHHPNEYPEPLSTQECLRSVVDPKDTLQNKHRYVVASQDQEVRKMLRGIRGVPLIYIKRSVMILEPMADESVQVRAKEERSKFRAEIKNALGKRKRADAGDDDEKAEKNSDETTGDQKKKKKGYGSKGPNPLAVQKSKKPKTEGKQSKKEQAPEDQDTPQEGSGKRKRRRRNKTATASEDQGEVGTAAAGAEVVAAET